MIQGGEIQIETEQRDGWVVLMIKDNGCACRKSSWNTLFSVHLKLQKTRMGIGLFQSKKIIEVHGGKSKSKAKKEKEPRSGFPANGRKIGCRG